MEAGDTLKFGQLPHLWVVVSEPNMDSDHVVIINMTTDRGIDESCILNSGDHSYICHRTAMRYDKSLVKANSELEHLLSAGYIRLFDPLSRDILERIRQGAAISEYIPLKCRKVLVEQGLIEP